MKEIFQPLNKVCHLCKMARQHQPGDSSGQDKAVPDWDHRCGHLQMLIDQNIVNVRFINFKMLRNDQNVHCDVPSDNGGRTPLLCQHTAVINKVVAGPHWKAKRNGQFVAGVKMTHLPKEMFITQIFEDSLRKTRLPGGSASLTEVPFTHAEFRLPVYADAFHWRAHHQPIVAVPFDETVSECFNVSLPLFASPFIIVSFFKDNQTHKAIRCALISSLDQISLFPVMRIWWTFPTFINMSLANILPPELPQDWFASRLCDVRRNQRSCPVRSTLLSGVRSSAPWHRRPEIARLANTAAIMTIASTQRRPRSSGLPMFSRFYR